MELGKVRERLGERGLKLKLSDEAKKFLIRKGSNTDFGARPLRRSIENFVEDPLSEELLKGEFQGSSVGAECPRLDRPARCGLRRAVRRYQQRHNANRPHWLSRSGISG